MKTQKRQKPKSSAPCNAVDAWPLLAAYLDLAERHANLLCRDLEAATAKAVADIRNGEARAEMDATLADIAAAIHAMPAPKLFS